MNNARLALKKKEEEFILAEQMLNSLRTEMDKLENISKLKTQNQVDTVSNVIFGRIPFSFNESKTDVATEKIFVFRFPWAFCFVFALVLYLLLFLQL